MLKFGHPKVAVVPLLGILFLSVGFLAATAAIGGVRINTSYSLPLGIYVRTTEHRRSVPHCRSVDSLDGRCYLIYLLCRGFIASGRRCESLLAVK